MSSQSADTKNLAKELRKHSLRMVHRVNASHIGTCLSAADILAVLYGKVLNIDSSNPEWKERDIFIMSKGHGAAVLYAVLAESGFFSVKDLETYGMDGSHLAGHVTKSNVPGVELSTGSLGHGLSVGCGMAIARKHDQNSSRVFVMISDGEMDEGSIWEPLLFAPQQKLDNLTVIVDYNKIQSFGTVKEVLDLEPLAEKWKAARWAVREIDGHQHDQIEAALKEAPFEQGKPSVIIANTVKGKGVSYMENQLKWHYSAPNEEQLEQALNEVDEAS